MGVMQEQLHGQQQHTLLLQVWHLQSHLSKASMSALMPMHLLRCSLQKHDLPAAVFVCTTWQGQAPILSPGFLQAQARGPHRLSPKHARSYAAHQHGLQRMQAQLQERPAQEEVSQLRARVAELEAMLDATAMHEGWQAPRHSSSNGDGGCQRFIIPCSADIHSAGAMTSSRPDHRMIMIPEHLSEQRFSKLHECTKIPRQIRMLAMQTAPVRGRLSDVHAAVLLKSRADCTAEAQSPPGS